VDEETPLEMSLWEALTDAMSLPGLRTKLEVDKEETPLETLEDTDACSAICLVMIPTSSSSELPSTTSGWVQFPRVKVRKGGVMS
jgi:hypothetical protein